MKNTLTLFIKNKYGIVSKIATYQKTRALKLVNDNEYKNVVAKTMNTTSDNIKIVCEWFMNNQTGELFTFTEALKDADKTRTTIDNYTKVYQ